MLKIGNITINIENKSPASNEVSDIKNSTVGRDELVNTLRIISEDRIFVGQTIVIPDNCMHYGFAEGEFDLPELLYFLADMLE
ncbi:hypothetical protein [Psychrobacter alimentarius]|uniref:hypothetical protein n=1 Tax=Psychrobacter alimentarius TaxID=261164 RepID=UPI00191ACC8C|nr:hypothetical protein [Psychrobacter alimentarius]